MRNLKFMKEPRPVPLLTNVQKNKGSRLSLVSKYWKTSACCRVAELYNRRLMTYPPKIKRALRIIIICQCTGMIGPLLFGNGFMLAYILRLGIPAYRVLFLFALMPLINMSLTLPFARLADRTGKSRLGLIGLTISIVGFLMLPLASLLPNGSTVWWLSAGIIIFSIGNTANSSCWFALLSPIVPQEIRGRWFGKMRTSWQSTAIVFSLSVAALLRFAPHLYVFQLVLVVGGALMLIRRILYKQIPELDPIQPPATGFFKTLGILFKIPGYLRFCFYIFLLSFASAAAGLLGLLEKEALGFSDSLLMVMGNLLSIGAIAGFLIGGKMVDRFGAKPVFLTSHIITAITLTGILMRGYLPISLPFIIGMLSLLFGASQGATGIASTSELLALIPSKNKSLSIGFNLTLAAAGISLAGLLNGQLLKMNILPAQWTLLGHSMSAYDALLVGFLLITIILGATLGLVPTIRQLHSQWFPQNR